MSKERLAMTFVSLVVSCAAVAAADAATDEAVKRQIAFSCSIEDNPSLETSAFDRAFGMTGRDRVRFGRILAEMAEARDGSLSGLLINRMGFYGSAEQLPFLYSRTTNAVYGVEAARAILRIEGVTSNSIAGVESFLSMTNAPMPSREDLCLELLSRRTGAGDLMRRDAEDCAYRFFAADDVYDGWYDGRVRALLPGYEHSKRRLAVLRSVQALGLNRYNETFITNAIRELVAYPEADLPD